MASTVLTILGDATGGRRALADVRGEHARANAAMRSDDARAARERRRAEAEEVAEARRQLRAMQGARQRAARERQRAESQERRARDRAARQEAAAKQRADRQEVSSKAKAEREKTRVAAQEARKREREAAKEANARRREEERITKDFEKQVRDRARVAQRELNARNRAESRSAERGRRERGRDIVSGVSTAAGAARGTAEGIHGQISSARDAHAALQGQVIDAVSQVGVTDLGEVDRYVNAIVDRALQEGMRPEDFAGAIGQAQTEFSALGAMENLGGARNAGARAAVFNRAINTAATGRNMGVDPGEFSRLMGMLNNQGLDSGTQDFLAAWTVGAAQRGAVEPGAITREAMGPIIQRMQAAMAAAKPEGRQQAASDAFRQAFAEIQVLRGAGESARLSGNAMASWNRALSNTGTQAKMRENVSHIADRDQRRRVQETLFDRDGALRAELRNPVAFTGAMMGAGVDDPTTMANIFAGTGAGNAQSMQANFRRMMMGLASNGGVDKVKALTDSSSALSPERIAALAAMRRGSEQANLNRNEVAQAKALTDNTNELVKLSHAFSDWSARNPMGSTALTVGGGAAASWIGGKVLEKVAGGAGAGAAGGAGAGAAGGAGAGAAGAARVGVAGGLGVAALLASAANSASTAITGQTLDGRDVGNGAMGTLRRVSAGVSAVTNFGLGESGRQLGEYLGPKIVEALRGITLTATVEPHDLEHQAMRGSSRRAE